MPFRVDSEVGRLRKVIVHRPGLEQRRLTPQTAAELLFDDVIWVRRAEEEHAAFVALLRERGIEVFDAADLLLGVLEDDDRPRVAARPGAAGARGRPVPRAQRPRVGGGRGAARRSPTS